MPRTRTRKRPLRRKLARVTGDILRAAGVAAAPGVGEIICRSEAAIRPDTLDEAARSVDAIFATEAPLVEFDASWRLCRVVLLADAMVRTEQAPLQDTHNIYTAHANLGSVRNLRAERGRNVGTLIFADDDESERIFAKVRGGHLRGISVRARILRAVEIAPGKTRTVQGASYTAGDDMPTKIATRWQPIEISVCAVGKDPGAAIRNNLHQTTNTGAAVMTFEQYCAKRGFNPDELTDVQRAALQADYEAEIARAETGHTPATPAQPEGDTKRSESTPPATPPAGGQTGQAAGATADEIERMHMAAAEKAQAAIAQREADRVEAIRALADDDVPESLITRAIDSRWTVERAKDEILKHIRENRPNLGTSNFRVGGGEVSRAVLEASLALREGMDEDSVQRTYGEETIERAATVSRHSSLLDLCRSVLTLERRDIPHDREDLIRAAWTTTNLSLIFSNVANLFVMQGFNTASATWRLWCQILPANDFKQHTGVRLTANGRFEEVNGATGEIAQGRATEEGETYSIGTHAQNLAITRKHIIDDSLGLLNTLQNQVGAEAMELVDDLVYTCLLGNATAMRDTYYLFDADDHLNYNTGDDALDLADENLSAAKKKFRQQVGPNGRRLNRDPRILLIPDELQRTAMKLLNSVTLIGYGGGNNTTEGDINVHHRTLQPVVESRLSDSTFHASASESTWYLSAPAANGAIGVAFLNGRQSPTVTAFQAGPDYVAGGIIVQTFLDVGVAPWEYRNIQRNDAPEA